MMVRDRLFLDHILDAIGEIAGTKERLIHAYFNVDLDAVWSMIAHDFPELRRDVAHSVDHMRHR